MTADTAFWNGLAEKYSKQPVANPDAFERKIEITKSRMRPGDVVLDIGCGTGSLALRLAPHAAEVHGLDVSSEMIRIAEDKARAAQIHNVRFHIGAFDDGLTAFGPESLDGICAYSILHLVEDRAVALDRMYRLLKPGGFLVASTVCIGESWAPMGPVLSVMRWLGKAPMVKVFSKQQLSDDVRRAGFGDVSHPEVGAKSNIAFTVAAKPASRPSAQPRSVRQA